MNRVLHLQVSIFGSFENIGNEAMPTEDLTALLSAFDGELKPSFMRLVTLGSDDSPTGIMTRLNLISTDNRIAVAFFPDRIDCNYSGREGVVSPREIDIQLQSMSTLLLKGLTYFSAIGNRLAVNGRYDTSGISTDVANYLIPRGFYRDERLAEWSVDCNRVVPIMLAGKAEDTNNILSIVGRSEQENDSVLTVTFDVNTRPENTLMRFDGNSLTTFVEQIIPNLNAMLEGMR